MWSNEIDADKRCDLGLVIGSWNIPAQSTDRCGVALPWGWRAICLPLAEGGSPVLKYKTKDGKEAVMMTTKMRMDVSNMESISINRLRRR